MQNFAFAPHAGRVYSPAMADELQPLPSSLSAEQVHDLAGELNDLGMSKDFIALIERGLHSAKLPKALRGMKAAEAFQSAFEIIGGVPRLALWADKNPEKFYPLLARMIPQTVSPVVAELPQGTQKDKFPTMPWLTARRLMYQESLEVAEDIKINGTNSE